jgi:hypothetical protein
MTFGQIKSIIEKNLVESYNKPTSFKQTLREFKHNVLENKNFAKLYSLYDDLLSPKGLKETEAREYLDEGMFTKIWTIWFITPKSTSKKD